MVAANRAIAKAAPSILSSALTTVVGLLMLCFMRLKIGADMGIVLAQGVVCSLICTFTAIDQQLAGDVTADTISAVELFLLQHTCHWYCKSRLVASGRMLARHGTSYHQLLAAVRPRTRADYLALVR